MAGLADSIWGVVLGRFLQGAGAILNNGRPIVFGGIESQVLPEMDHLSPFVQTEALAATSAAWLRRLLSGAKRAAS